MQQIRRGDQVQIIRGADRPHTDEDKKKSSGEVIEVDTVAHTCKVAGKNMVWRHRKGTGQDNPGGRVQVEAAMPLSNVMLFNPKSQRPERVGTKDVDGKRVRYFKKSGNTV